MKTIILSFILSLFISNVIAQPLSFSSKNKRVNILELYTSEGCSSCPPADKWLSQYKDDSRLWKTLIPIAFHVDYWNYIGWSDRFSSKIFTRRQQTYAHNKNISSVYTPGVILNGKEWRGWYRGKQIQENTPNDAGSLHIELENNQFSAHYSNAEISADNIYLNIAILGFDLVTEVKSGENSGRQLEHDFVVLSYQRLAMTQTNDGYSLASILTTPNIKAPRQGLAIWVDADKDLSPIQATGGWL